MQFQLWQKTTKILKHTQIQECESYAHSPAAFEFFCSDIFASTPVAVTTPVDMVTGVDMAS